MSIATDTTEDNYVILSEAKDLGQRGAAPHQIPRFARNDMTEVMILIKRRASCYGNQRKRV